MQTVRNSLNPQYVEEDVRLAQVSPLSRTSSPSPTIWFHKVDFESSPYSQYVRHNFKTVITSIYGDQTSALQKLEEGADRECEIMIGYDNPLGIIVYKNKLQEEYGLQNAFELKTLCLLNAERNSGKGFGTALWHRVDEKAVEMGAKVIYCTASSKVADSIKCAVKNGFAIEQLLKDENGVQTYLLCKRLA